MPNRFPFLIRVLHWTMALLLIAMLMIGVAMVATAGPAYSALIALHRPLGIAILLLALLRAMIRFATTAPELPAGLLPLQAKAARASHILLYAAMVGLPLIGWAMLSAGGYPVRLTAGLVLPPIVPQNALAYGLLRQAHTLVAFAFLALVLGHLTIALVHGYIRRDGVLATMTFGKKPAGQGEPARAEVAEFIDGTDALLHGDANESAPSA